MQNVKLGKFFDDEGESISDVETVLENLGLTLRDKTTGQFRDMGDVLNETMVLWNELGAQGKTLEQSMLANAFAGNRQSEVLKSLMGSQKEYLAALEIEAESLGLTEQRYKIFSDNVEAAKNKFTASLEEMWSKTITPETIKNFADLGTKIIGVIDALGGLIPILKAIGAALIVINYQTILTGLGSLIAIIPAVITGLTGVTFGLGGVTTALAATTVGTAAATAGISILVGALVLLISNIKTAEERVVALNAAFQEDSNQYNKDQEELKKLAERYEELSKKANKSLEDNIELLDIQTTLNTRYGALTSGLNLYTDAIDGNSKAIETNIAWIKAQQGVDSLRFLREQADKYGSARDYLDSQKKYGVYNLGKFGGMGTEQFTPEERLDYLGGQLAKGKENIGEFNYNEITREFKELSAAIEAATGIIIAYEHNTNILKATNDGAADAARRFGGEQGDLVDALADAANALDGGIAPAEEYERSLDDVASTMDAVTAAQKEQIDNGYISAQTAIELISANASLAQYLTQTANGYLFDAEAARQATYQEMLNAFTKYGIASAAVAAANGNYKFAMSAIAAANATKEEKEQMIGLLNAFAAMSISVGSVGGGGGAASQANVDAQNAEIDAINNQIDALHDQQDALKDLLKAYKKIIDAQKEKLRLAKEEDDYQKSLEEKNKELVDIDNELLAIQFDNSQEANARRLELEELRAEKTEEIAELQADRTYDIQIQALDAEYAAYEEWINNQLAGIDRLIEGFNRMIEAIREVIEALQQMNSQGGGGGYGGVVVIDSNSNNDGGMGIENFTAGGGWSDGFYNSQGEWQSDFGGFSQGGMGVIPPGYPDDTYPLMAESGEMFMIFNQQQQQQLARGAQIPNMDTVVANSGGASGGIVVGDISISVAGNLDRVGLDDIKTAVFDVLNSASNQRGKRANALTYSV